VQTTSTWAEWSRGVPVAACAAVATLVAALLLALTAASSATADAAGGSIYWTNAVAATDLGVGTTIGRANKDATGANQAFIGGASLPTGLAVDTAHVYWINDLDKSIGRANLDGTGVNQRFITGVTGDSLAVDGGHIYWTDLASVLNPAGTVGRANIDGTGVDQNFIVTSAESPSGVAVDSAHVYWTNPSSHAIGRANLDGTGVNQNFLDVGLGRQPFGIAVDTAHIYWTDLLNQAIGRANLDGTALNPNFIEGARFPLAVVVDSAHIYWTDFNIPTTVDGADGAIGRANLDGTDVNQTFITGAREPEGVAVDAATQTAPPSRISIGDVRMAEGNTGQSAFQFTVSLDQARSAPVTVDVTTADGTATAASGDFLAARGTLTFAPGETTKAITVQVNGDTDVEPDETFSVNLSNATGNATIADGQGIGTILNDDQPVTTPPANISIADASLAEGDSGQTAFPFVVTLDQAESAPVTVDFSTGDRTATAPSDYAATSGTLTFAPGETAKTITVQVNGDTTVEPNETYTVNLANATGNAMIADPQATGTILNDDQPVTEQPAGISIADLSRPEGNTGQTPFGFTVSLDRTESAPVSIDFSTADGTATAASDYISTNGTLTFAPGETTKTITVQVNTDTIKEPNETFTVNLTNAVGNATVADAQAVGTIINDDRKHAHHKRTLGKTAVRRADRRTQSMRHR
jgi:hypothetical protein